MNGDPERGHFERWSAGEISRLELGDQLGREVSFADALLKLYEYGLPLPRPPVDRNSEGVRLISDLVRGAAPI